MAVWLTFFCFAFLGIGLVLVPGFLVLLSIGFSKQDSLMLSPAISLFLYCAAGIVLSSVGVFASWASVLAVVAAETVVLVGLVRFVLGRSRAPRDLKEQPITPHMWAYVALYLIAGLGISVFVFAKSLDGPYSFCTSSDYSFHISLVRSFLDSGSFSVLHCDLYPDSIREASFYPAAWHVFSAVLASLTGSVTMAGNITNFIVLAFIFPMSCLALFSRLFKDNFGALVSGSVLCLSFVGFPWILLIWGQLSSNLMSFALVPSFVVLFWDLLLSASGREACMKFIALLMGASSLVFAQTNGLFTAGIFCIPLIFVFANSKLDQKKSASRLLKVLVNAGIALCLVAIWALAFKAPFLQSVVGVNRSFDMSLVQALKNVLAPSFGSLQEPQPLLGVFVLIGLVAAMMKKGQRPLGFLYIGVAAIYVINDAFTGEFQHFFSGFWYNDYYRTGAMVVLVAIPLACLGVQAIVNLVGSVFSRGGQRVAAAVLSCALLLLNFVPLGSAFGFDPSKAVTSEKESLSQLYSMDYSEGMTAEEWSFVEEAQGIVGDSLVLNISVDGSGFLYAYNDMNVYLRRIYPWPTSEDGQYLANNLCNIATDTRVQEIVNSLNARYVLLLDANGADDGGSVISYMYDEQYWRGILQITPETPGFKLLLSENDMRLYEIVE